MKDDLKFRYVLKGKIDNKIYFKWYYLNQIEIGLNKLFDVENYEILSKDKLTGIEDIKGKEIYNGDIVKICKNYNNGFLRKGDISVIEWCKDELCYFLIGTGKYRLTKNKKIEVIGNIYENTEIW